MGTKTRQLIETGRIITAVMKFSVTVVGLTALFLLCVTLPVALPLALLALITDGFSPKPSAWFLVIAVCGMVCEFVWPYREITAVGEVGRIVKRE